MPDNPIIVKQKKQPPYLLGLLGLMPLVGAFVGLGLLLYGIIYYKDKWLAIIGGAGILFTVLVYGSLFYYMTRSNAFKDGFSPLAQMQLNELVKDVEFYKLQYNEYPDSLKQVVGGNVFINIIDPSQGTRGVNFNYRKIGDKYTLFSSGHDGKAGTPDDFYPQVFIPDSSKIGLIRLPGK